MADMASDPNPNGGRANDIGRRAHQASTTGAPRWVKAFAIVVVVLVLSFVVLHLAGYGFGGHTSHAAGTHRP
jgi:hypothetical protein